jgi:hypothetical protein
VPPCAQAGASPSVRKLSDILSSFLQLLDREQARAALAGSNPFAARVLEALDASTGAAPAAPLQPLVVVPLPPPAAHAAALYAQQQQAHAQHAQHAHAHAHAPPPQHIGRSPHGAGARKATAPRKRSAGNANGGGGAGGASRSIRFAADAGGGVPSLALPPGVGSFQELLGGHLDASLLGELINGDDARLYALGERVASALPPLDQWEVRETQREKKNRHTHTQARACSWRVCLRALLADARAVCVVRGRSCSNGARTAAAG